MIERLPAIFFGHGNPMNALAENGYTRAWRSFGEQTPRPKAILAISAHWFVPHTRVTISTAPRTIHDFGGFPRELYQVEYPAPGHPVLARRVQQMLAPMMPAQLDDTWGLDHGTWAVLCHVYPDASVPIVQLSINLNQPPETHFEIGRRLAALRDEGILIVGSGNLVHNLRSYAWGVENADPHDWATRFEATATEAMLAGEYAPLLAYEKLGRDALLSVPTPDHYLPLLYVLGTRQQDEALTFPVNGIEGGSISMLAVEVGGPTVHG